MMTQGRQGWGKRRRWSQIPWLPGVIAAALGSGLALLGAWEPLERFVYQGLFLTRDRLNPVQWDERLVVIAIDNASLSTYGSYPWSRDRYADLLDTLMTVQPAAVGFDILMAESTPADARFAESLHYSGNGVLAVGDDGQGNAILVTPTVAEAAEGFIQIGHVKHTPDEDGVSRQVFLYERHGENFVPSFAIALVQTYERSLANLLTPEQVQQPDLNPVFFNAPERFDQRHPLWVNWPGLTRPVPGESRSPQGLRTLSFAEVMADNTGDLLASLQNKLVLVGYTATGIVGQAEDPLRTPFEQQIPSAGVYLHAAIADNLLNDRFLMRLPPGWTLTLVALSGLSSVLLKPLGLRGRLAIVVGLIPAGFAITYLFFLAGLWMPLAAPIGTTLFGMLAFQVMEQRERQALMDLFAINLSPEMAAYIWQNQGQLLTEGQILPQALTATLLFSDIRGFTSISETLPSEVLLSWLNRYFEAMTDCIMAHGGVVDKYIGDAIMAAFGAPIPRTGEQAVQADAIAAVAASLDMVERLQHLNDEFAAEGLPQVKFGIGLHTGSLVGGTVGSRHRASYSLFGDTVNVAARLQEMTKQLTAGVPYPILLSEATHNQVRDRFEMLEQGQLQLRGRTTSTRVYTPVKSVPAPEGEVQS